MASSTMFSTEITTSSFLGTSMAKVEMGEARVSMMAFSRQELERKPLSLIRTLARQRGIRLTTKHEMINALASAPYSYSAPKSYSAAPTKSSGGAVSAEEAALLAKSLGELRALAKAKGLRGDTKAEIVKLLISAGGVSSSTSSFDSYSSSSSFSSGSSYASAPAASPGLDTASLERKSLAELRALARVRGLRGDTKAELIKLLSSGSGSAPAAVPATGNGASTSYYGNNGASYGVSTGANISVTIRQLSVKSLSQLKAMAAIKGIRGTTKAELVRQLAAAS